MIRLKDVQMEYENGTKAIKGITLTIEDGEFVFLVGPSGSGKSTIIKLLTGEVEPCAGRIMINGFSVSNISDKQIPLMRRTLGVIFQDFRLIEKKTVYDNLPLLCGQWEHRKRRSANGFRMCCTWWIWRTKPTVIPRSFPVVSSSGWRLPGHW